VSLHNDVPPQTWRWYGVVLGRRSGGAFISSIDLEGVKSLQLALIGGLARSPRTDRSSATPVTHCTAA